MTFFCCSQLISTDVTKSVTFNIVLYGTREKLNLCLVSIDCITCRKDICQGKWAFKALSWFLWDFSSIFTDLSKINNWSKIAENIIFTKKHWCLTISLTLTFFRLSIAKTLPFWDIFTLSEHQLKSRVADHGKNTFWSNSPYNSPLTNFRPFDNLQ